MNELVPILVLCRMAAKPLAQIFLCHASEDKPRIRKLCARLRSDGFATWFDEQNLLPGQRWKDEITRALPMAGAVIICLSRCSCRKRGFVQREIRIALDAAQELPEGTLFVVPTRLEPCELPDSLRDWQAVDLFARDGYERLRTSLTSHSFARKLWSATPDDAKAPVTDADSLGDLLEQFHTFSLDLAPSLGHFADNFSAAAARWKREQTLDTAVAMCVSSRAAFAEYARTMLKDGTCPARISHQLAGTFADIDATPLPKKNATVKRYLDSVALRKHLVKVLDEKGPNGVKAELMKQIRRIKQP